MSASTLGDDGHIVVKQPVESYILSAEVVVYLRVCVCARAREARCKMKKGRGYLGERFCRGDWARWRN